MKSLLRYLAFLAIASALAQSARTLSPFDGASWGVVLEHPDMKKIELKQDVTYLMDEKDTLRMDIYLPLNLKKNEARAAIVFLNGLGDEKGRPSSKSRGIYSSWPRLAAAHGLVGISMESEGSRIQECFEMLFKYLGEKGQTLHVDSKRIGVYAASANIRESASYLMKPTAFPGIKAAALYYGEVPMGPYRKDLPVMFVVAEKDLGGRSYTNLWSEVLKNNSPWTIKLATGLPHAFDAFSDTEESKKIILETISFWKNHLEPVPVSVNPPAKIREIIAMQYDGDFAQVAQRMREWFKENPDSQDAGAYSLFGNALMRTEQFAEAEDVIKKSIGLNPGNKGILLNMVVISYALGKSAEAEKYLQQFEKGSTPEGFTYGYIGRFLLRQKKYDVAARYFERAIDLGPHRTDYYNLACCLALAGEKNKAFDNLFKAVEKGITSKQGYETDATLQTLKSDPRWTELLKKLE